MKILAVDDEELQLKKLTTSIEAVVPDAEVFSTQRPSQALFHAEENSFDIAFLDVQMRGMTGVELGALLKRLNPRVNIIFVTAFDDYKADAMDIRASGYISKPVTEDKVAEEMRNLRYEISHGSQQYVEKAAGKPKDKEPLIHVHCFGNFDVFDRDHKPIHFPRSKAKEMMAYLIFKKGARCTSREIAGILYEDEEYNSRIQDQFRHVNAAMMRALRDVGAEEVVLKDHSNYAIDQSRVECDFYRYLREDPEMKNRYTGEFMSQYSWAEYMNAYLDQQR